MQTKFVAVLLGPQGGLTLNKCSGPRDTIEQARVDGGTLLGNNPNSAQVGILKMVEVGQRESPPIGFTATTATNGADVSSTSTSQPYKHFEEPKPAHHQSI